jgi:DsbC/DsbD-like thiol-disulfide interchange protein
MQTPMQSGRASGPDRRIVLSGLAAIAAAGPSTAAPSSPWARSMSSRMRLWSAGQANVEGLRVAVVEIALDKGFKTYWRTPGDSGIPPAFSFDGSENVRDIEVRFPAPRRFDDGAGGHSIGYLGPTVELPVTFQAMDPSKSVRLKLKLDYAVCEKICVPANGQAEIATEPGKAISSRAVQLLADLPTRQPLGAPEPMSILKLMKGNQAEHFVIEAAAPSPGAADVFIEAASPWIFDAKAGQRLPDGRVRFTALAIDRDKSPDCKGVEITLTLISEKQAVETTTWLDLSLLQA